MARMSLWKVAPAVLRPKGSEMNSNNPRWVTTAGYVRNKESNSARTAGST